MGNRIREIRKRRNLTQKQLAAKIGVADSTVSQYETGKRSVDNETLLKLGEVLGVSIDEILGREGLREAPAKDATPTFDDFTFAMQNETKDLTEMDKQILLSMAKQLNDARKARDGDTE